MARPVGCKQRRLLHDLRLANVAAEIQTLRRAAAAPPWPQLGLAWPANPQPLLAAAQSPTRNRHVANAADTSGVFTAARASISQRASARTPDRNAECMWLPLARCKLRRRDTVQLRFRRRWRSVTRRSRARRVQLRLRQAAAARGARRRRRRRHRRAMRLRQSRGCCDLGAATRSGAAHVRAARACAGEAAAAGRSGVAEGDGDVAQ